MRCRLSLTTILALLLNAAAVWPQVQPARWRGAGPTPCVGSDGGILQCPAAEKVIAVLAGRLFDSNTGQMSIKQMVLISGERITRGGTSGANKHSERGAGH